jgi:gamma-butyrobetaine dioxygenase
LHIEWNDGRQSEHDADWLRDNDYGSEAHRRQRRPVKTWNAADMDRQPDFDYAALRDDEGARLALIEHLIDFGTAKLINVPATESTVTEVGDWFGHRPDNLYSDDPEQPTICNIRIDPRVPVATSQCHFLGPHTDTCWRQTLIGLLLMHCLKAHPEGGRSIVVDGFAVAERLREQDRDAFDLLARVPLDFGSKVADRDDWRVLGRVISVAADGAIEGIRYNGNSIGQLDLPSELIEPTYRALESFDSILHDRELWWQPLLQPGDLMIYDNHRVLHGREAFDPTLGERHLQCCAVDRDDFHNRYRRLARKLGAAGADLRLSAGVI